MIGQRSYCLSEVVTDRHARERCPSRDPTLDELLHMPSFDSQLKRKTNTKNEKIEKNHTKGKEEQTNRFQFCAAFVLGGDSEAHSAVFVHRFQFQQWKD